jgi:hypothetical protein
MAAWSHSWLQHWQAQQSQLRHEGQQWQLSGIVDAVAAAAVAAAAAAAAAQLCSTAVVAYSHSLL